MTVFQAKINSLPFQLVASHLSKPCEWTKPPQQQSKHKESMWNVGSLLVKTRATPNDTERKNSQKRLNRQADQEMKRKA